MSSGSSRRPLRRWSAGGGELLLGGGVVGHPLADHGEVELPDASAGLEGHPGLEPLAHLPVGNAVVGLQLALREEGDETGGQVKADKVVDTVIDNRADCGKMASGLNAVVDANQDTIAMARSAKAMGKRLPAATVQQMQDGARRMLAALDKCGRDDKVGAAFRRIDLGTHR